MEYILAIDGETPFGRFLLALAGKPGGASDVMNCGMTRHPVIVAKEIDWITIAPFVRMTHIRMPLATDQMPTELVVPGHSILFAMPRASPIPDQGQSGPAPIPPKPAPVH